MASSTTLCGPCSERHITKQSAYWCSECEEAICDDCQEHHRVLKATRSHELIPIGKYKSLPSFITDIQQSCTYHNEKYQHYCVAHALSICFKCIKEHQRCNVIPLDEVTSNAKTSGQLQDLETRMVDLLQNIDRIGKDRMSNLARIEKRKINQIRNQINKHLDKLEKDIKQDLEKKDCQCKKNVQKFLSAVTEKASILTEYQTNFKSIKQHASNLQTFLVMRDIEIKVLENEQFLHSLIETKQIEQVDLVVQFDPGLLNISNSLKHFGKIEIKTQSSSIRLIRAKDKQAQLQVIPKKTINDSKLVLEKQISIPGKFIRGCCMSVSGELFFTDHYLGKTLSVIASDGTLKYNMLLGSSGGFDITCIDEKTIAVTSGESKTQIGIDIIDTKHRKKIRFISLPGRPWGITRDQDSLFVCVEECGIYKLNTRAYTTSLVISWNVPTYSYISVFNDIVCFTDGRDDSVVCCDCNGSRVWTYKYRSVLSIPRGITVDNDGKVFVVGEASSNVVIISNDGNHFRHILTDKDGIHEPSAIFFHKQTSKLLVANENRTAFLYNVA